jgi:hypothetical protein
MALEVLVMSKDTHKNVAVLNRIIDTNPPLLIIRALTGMQIYINDKENCTDSCPLKKTTYYHNK